jgi:dTDP-4-dehydrorhamnose reductase
MLGSQVFEILRRKDFEIFSTTRDLEKKDNLQYRFGVDDLANLILKIPGLDYVVNCLGAIPQRNKDSENFKINWEVPSSLKHLAEKFNFKVIQIATDCAYDGDKGNYSEADSPNPKDEYGISKLLGEVISPNFMHLRCSIIGNDKESSSLYSWLLSNQKDSVIRGYTNHLWNGVTTLAFAKIVSGIVSNNHFIPGLHHLVPSSSVTKFQLLQLISEAENRSDLSIVPFETKVNIDRTLTTTNQSLNQELWKYGGYQAVPSVVDLVNEFALLNSERREEYE